MTEAVIVATTRSPIGRAFKGSLKDMRPDDMAAQIVKAIMAKVPQLDSDLVEDLMLGCGQPAGEAGFNVARVVAVLAGLSGCPGVTVNRYCSSSLQTIRMAAHAIRAGEGDVFLAAGVETTSRFFNGSSDGVPGTHNPVFADGEARTARRAEGGAEAWAPAEGLPDIYIAMGQTAENVAEYENVSRQEMDEFATLSQNRAVANQANGFFEREITPVTLEDGTEVSRDDGPRPDTTVEGLARLQPAFRPDGRVTAGNACPLNDGAAAVIVMSDTRARELGLTPLARVVSSGVSALDPEIMGLGPVEASRQALKRRDEHRRRGPRRDKRGLRRPGHPLRTTPRHRVGQAQRPRWGDRPRPSLRHDRRPHHDNAHQRPRERRQDHRARDDVRGRWPGHGDDRGAARLRTQMADGSAEAGPGRGSAILGGVRRS